MNELIENLLLRKSFDQLDEQERPLVLAELSREEYEQLRAVLLAAPALDPGPPPADTLRASLLSRMRETPPDSTFWQRPVARWKAAAAIAFILAGMWYFKKPLAEEVPPPLVQVKTDTLYREKIVWKERIIVREKLVFRELPPPAADTVRSVHNPTPSIRVDLSGNAFAAPQLGTSLQDEPALMDFFEEIK